jgi:hypothetical protein
LALSVIDLFALTFYWLVIIEKSARGFFFVKLSALIGGACGKEARLVIEENY